MALVQFRPGRIDHHNAQILCAVAGLMFLVRSLEEERVGWIAGALIGLGLAIGYEAISPGRAGPWPCRLRSPVGAAKARRVSRAATAATVVTAGCPARDRATRAGSTSVATRCRSTCLCSPASAPPPYGAHSVCRRSRERLAGLASRSLRGVGAALDGRLEPAFPDGPVGWSIRRSRPIWLDG